MLPAAAAAERARAGGRDAYEAKGSSVGTAAFIATTSRQAELTAEYVAPPAPDPVVWDADRGRRLPR